VHPTARLPRPALSAGLVQLTYAGSSTPAAERAGRPRLSIIAMDSFAGKLAVVTGAVSGMGRELTRQLAVQGCSVAACDLNPDTMAETVALAQAEAPPGVRGTGPPCALAHAAHG